MVPASWTLVVAKEGGMDSEPDESAAEFIPLGNLWEGCICAIVLLFPFSACGS